MHIKRVVLTDFLSYKGRVEITNFSPHLNAVVGRNGSGKSNFYTAIEFVLSGDRFYLRGPKERISLINQSSTTHRPMFAKVEVVIDNADRRIPNKMPEVTFARLVTKSKDQFLVNGKIASFKEMRDMLQIAGFPSVSSYFIVQQGTIMGLAIASDKERMAMLHSLAGGDSFKAKKRLSIEHLEQSSTENEILKLQLVEIQKQVTKLQSESRQTRKYLELDRERRALELAIGNARLNSVNSELERLRLEIGRSGFNTAENKELSLLKSDIEKFALRKQRAEAKAQRLEEEKKSLLIELKSLTDERANLQALVDILQRGDTQTDIDKEILHARQRIEEKEVELAQVQHNFQELLKKESLKRQEVAEAKSKVSQLKTCTGFRNVQERNNHLDREHKSLEKQKETLGQEIEKLNDIVCDIETTKNAEDGKLTALLDDIERKKEEAIVLQDQIDATRRQINDLAAQKLDAERSERDFGSMILQLKDEIASVVQLLRESQHKNACNGMVYVQQIVDEIRQRIVSGEMVSDEERHTANGYYGTVAELVEVDEQFSETLEVAGKSRLFAHIVKDHKTAQFLLHRFNEQHFLGDPSFMPLESLDPGSRKQIPPSIDTNQRNPQVVPLTDVLQFEPVYEKAFHIVFGSFLIINNRLQEEVRKELFKAKFNCITLEGVEYSCSGTVAGGFSDPQRRKLKLCRNIKTLKEVMAQKKEEQLKLEGEIEQKRGEISRLLQENETGEQDSQRLQDEYRGLVDSRHSAQEIVRRLQRQAEEMQKKRADVTDKMKEVEQMLSENRRIRTESFSEGDKNTRICDAEVELDKKVLELKAIVQRKTTHEKNQIESELFSNLRPKLDKLQSLKERMMARRTWNKDMKNSQDINELDKRRNEVQKRLEAVNEKIGEVKNDIKIFEKELRKFEDGEKALSQRRRDSLASTEKLHTRALVCQEFREEVIKQINESGALPPEWLTKFDHLNETQLMSKLSRTKEQLRRIGHVNHAAICELERVGSRQKALQDSSEKVEQQIQVLYNTLEEAEKKLHTVITDLYVSVKRNFKEIFKRLVPNGYGDLRIKFGNQNNQEESQQHEQNGDGVDDESVRDETNHSNDCRLPIELGLVISFTSNSSQDAVDVNTLSDGQRTLVALALIVAIQKVQPAPFYLFDEIDAALDARYRKGFADILYEMSQQSQFIVTTFHKELLQPARALFGVKFQNKVSHVDVISSKQADDFVDDAEAHT